MPKFIKFTLFPFRHYSLEFRSSVNTQICNSLDDVAIKCKKEETEKDFA